MRSRARLKGTAEYRKRDSGRCAYPFLRDFRCLSYWTARRKKTGRTRFCVVILRQSPPCGMPAEVLAAPECRHAVEFQAVRTRFCVPSGCLASGEAATG